jgi:S-formylglutathione hydrolase FrmB
MILINMSLYSESLGKKSSVNVLLPNNSDSGKRIKVLWLLHGMSDDHNGWLRCSNIEVLAEKYGIGVVMPNADLSFYVNMVYGGDYFTWISGELPQKLTGLLPLSDKPEDNYIAGISMGGYGAFYIAMNAPAKYNTAVSLSGPMRIEWINKVLTDERLAEIYAKKDSGLIEKESRAYSQRHDIPELLVGSLMEMSGSRTARAFNAMFGVDPVLEGNHYDIFYLAKKLHECNSTLKTMAFCGEQDYHYVSNIQFRDFAKDTNISYSLVTGSGAHTWQYWNGVIPVMMEDLFEK